LLEKFAFLVAITIPFDIRDMHYDDPGQKTIPQLFGLNKARALAIVFACISLMASASLYLTGTYGSCNFVAFALSAAVNIIFISNSDPKKSEMYFAGGVDSALLIQAVLVGLSSLIEG
jgi:4-hydroxybenzoate polyprenyltransferase